MKFKVRENKQYDIQNFRKNIIIKKKLYISNRVLKIYFSLYSFNLFYPKILNTKYILSQASVRGMLGVPGDLRNIVNGAL